MGVREKKRQKEKKRRESRFLEVKWLLLGNLGRACKPPGAELLLGSIKSHKTFPRVGWFLVYPRGQTRILGMARSHVLMLP